MADTLQRMAEGTCPPRYYLSSLDPGVGKTKTITHFIKILLQSQDHFGVSVLICVSRLDEIAKLAHELELQKDEFAVFTSNDDLNELGAENSNEARVLFTTQQMIEKRCDGLNFCDVEAFHYRGHAREVRIWDEAILPGQTITVNRDEIAHLFAPLRKAHPQLTDAVESFFNALRNAEDGAKVQVPNLEEDFNVDLNDVLGLLSGSHQSHRDAASGLWQLSGRSATVRRDGAIGNTALDFRDTLPEDLMPLLVLDASGRVRTTYRHWKERRGNLVMLSHAAKQYQNLNIYVWNKGGGKSSFQRESQALIDGIVSTINTKPREEWLVVHHKPGTNLDIPSQVRDLVDGDKGRIHFIHWGNHHGTNAYAHIKNVILAGTLFYRPSQYEALGRLGSGYAPDQALTRHDYEAVQVGEHSHLILQALCRGAVRKCINDACAPCDAYIIAAANSGIRQALPSIFPGCHVRRWQPIEKVLRGKVGAAIKRIQEHLELSPDTLITFKEVASTIGMSDMKNFRRSVRRNPDFEEALLALGVVEHGKGHNPSGFIKEAAVYGFTNDNDDARPFDFGTNF
ncbi:DEAD/DEAH box helicase family protein [Aestuariispira ectoiniformans]|uniref:DEAD/DEAH box helicase family protein n=1 Tax=Aestuariispira ectoiniformans TaxID=2775080 RepID=UPI00223BED13|nr:DEAD/DEAH box helicase family protein [Aestuariispira ectoiniformans]